MFDQSSRDALVHAYVEAYNARELSPLLDTLHREVRFSHVAGGDTTVATEGLDAFRERAEASLRLFSWRRQVVQAVDHDPGGVTLRIRFEGLLADDVPGLGRAGERVALAGTTRFTFRDGRIASVEDRT